MKDAAIMGALLAILFLSSACARPLAAQTQPQSHMVLSYKLLGGGTPPPPVLWFFSSGQNVSTQMSTTPTNYTMDTGAPWGVSKILPNSTSGLRWIINGSNTGVAANMTVLVSYFRQYYATFGMPVISGAGPFAPPVVNYTAFGQSKFTLAGQSGWADYGAPYTYADINGTQPGSRWYVSAPTGVVLNAFKIVPHYTEQFQAGLKLVTQGPDALKSTTFSATYGGAAVTRTLTPAATTYWLDANSTFGFQSLINSTTGTHRWVLHSVSPSKVTSPVNVTVTYIEQFPLSLAYSTVGGVAPSAPTVVGLSNGRQFSQQMFSGSPLAWVDSGSAYSVPNPLLGSSPDERWVTFSNTTGVAGAPIALDFQYFHQVLVNFSYSVVGGGDVSPSISYSYRGSPGASAVGTAQGSVWADYGTVVSVQEVFQGGSPQERWELKSAPQTTLTGPTALGYVYYHQYDVSVTYNIPGERQGVSPEFAGFAFGTSFSSQLPPGSSEWLDSGSLWSVSSSLQVLQGERWVAVAGANGTVGSPGPVSVVYVHEYLLSISADSQQGGEFGQSEWVQAGGNAQLSASPGQGWAFERWAGTGNGSYIGTSPTQSLTLSGPVQETAYFDLRYSVHVSGSGTVRMSVGSSTYTVGRDPLVIFLPPGTTVTLVAQPGILQSFLGWQGVSGGQAEGVAVTATSPTTVDAIFGLNAVEAYGLVALYFGVVVYAVAYIVWRRRSSPGALSKVRGAGSEYV